jgi:hypothetical protein
MELAVKLMGASFWCGVWFEELDRDADEETIKTAYRRLAKFYHPDGMLFTVISTFPIKQSSVPVYCYLAKFWL